MPAIRLAAAVLAVACISTAPARAEIKTQWVAYTHGEAQLKGYLAYDDAKSGKQPAIFMIHDRGGMTDRTKHTVENWAKLGYVVFAADIYGMIPKDAVDSGKQTNIYRQDRALMKARTQAGFDALIKQPMVDTAKIAMIGYCFGGTVSVEFGSTGAPLLANIVIHGSYGAHAPGWANNLKGRFIMLHGAEDPNYPTEVDKVIAELRNAKAEWEMQLYSGTGHGFSHPKNKAEERANAEATAHVVRTLKELFGI